MIAVGCVATGEAGMGLGAARAVIASPAGRGVEGMKATATVKTASGTKATTTVETTTATNMETATSATVETAAPATMETAAATTAMARLGYLCEREPRHCARQDPSKR
jgi:hypothetical protein